MDAEKWRNNNIDRYISDANTAFMCKDANLKDVVLFTLIQVSQKVKHLLRTLALLPSINR